MAMGLMSVAIGSNKCTRWLLESSTWHIYVVGQIFPLAADIAN